MRITEIVIKNFGTFYKNEYIFNLDKDGKNLLLYGENGSGKTSLFKALKYFFDSNYKSLDFNSYKNIFSLNNGYIQISLRKNKSSSERIFKWSSEITQETSDPLILQIAKTKGFFNYHNLLETHFLHFDKDEVNIFNLMINNLLENMENPLTNNSFKIDLEILVNSTVKDYQHILKNFNDGLTIALNQIEQKANDILENFNFAIKIALSFSGLKYNSKIKIKKDRIQNKNLILKVTFFNSQLSKHHHILNEAKLSAISISILFSTLLLKPKGELNILALDDLLIGLDMSNRLPILDILTEYFADYQIFFLTYDKQWFELVSERISTHKWKTFELYSSATDSFEIPIIKNSISYIEMSESFLNQRDLKASIVYLRSYFEDEVKRFCDKHKLLVRFSKELRKVQSEDYLQAIKNQKIDVSEIELYRKFILNPFNHSGVVNVESKEVSKAIESVKNFSQTLNNINIKQKELKKISSLSNVITTKKDILSALQNVKTTDNLNSFFQEHLLKDEIDLEELEKIFFKFTLDHYRKLFDSRSEEYLMDLFIIKDNYPFSKDNKIWCHFVISFSHQNIINHIQFIKFFIDNKIISEYDENKFGCFIEEITPF